MVTSTTSVEPNGQASYAPEDNPPQREMDTAPIKLKVQDLNISYSGHPALSNVNLDIRENEIFGIIGPANSGKTSFLRAINRMDLFVDGMKVGGRVELDGKDVRDWRNVYALAASIFLVVAAGLTGGLGDLRERPAGRRPGGPFSV